MSRLAFLVLALVLAAGCPKPGSQVPTGGFKVFYPEIGATKGLTATVGTRLQVKPAADCRNADGNEGRWTNTGAQVTTGLLPPGLALEDGAISGVPTEPGTFKATIRFSGVTCATTPSNDKLVHVMITVRPKK